MQKIKNLIFIPTDSQFKRKRTELLSQRNYLLKLTDWVELPHAILSSYEKKKWLRWRSKVRGVKYYHKIAEGNKALETLLNTKPDDYYNMDEKEVDKIFNSYMSDMTSFYIKYHLSDNQIINNVLSKNYTDGVKYFVDNNEEKLLEIRQDTQHFKSQIKSCIIKEDKIRLIRNVKKYINDMVL